MSQLIEAEMAQVMQREHEKATEIELQKEKERYFQSVHYQQQLESQLEEQERKKQEAYEEFLKEKLMIDEICRKIYEEDQRYIYSVYVHDILQRIVRDTGRVKLTVTS